MFRKAFMGLAWVAAVFGGSGALAATHCEPSERPGVERCVSGLPPAAIDAMGQTQRASQWCWAASISMVLRSHGLEVAQEQIVREHFGAAVDAPVEGQVITALLGRTWRDRSGGAVHMAADSVEAGKARLAAADVIGDMDEERPVVLVLPRHAVVLVRLEYERSVDPDGRAVGEPRVLQGLVLDPRAAAPRPLRADAPIVQLTRAAGERDAPLAAAGRVAPLRSGALR